MTKSNRAQFSFLSGLISPRMYGRVDLPQYMTSLRTCTNFLISPFGAAVRRSGTYYVSPLEDQTKIARSIPFIYSDTQAYNIEFANGTIRFYKDQGIILQSRTVSNGTFTGGITGWTSNSTGTGAISASSNQLQLTGVDALNAAIATSSELTYYGTGTYTVTLDVASNSVTYLVGTTSGASNIATGALTTGTGKTFTFTPTTNGSVFISFKAIASAQVDNVVISNATYKIDSPYLEADIPDISYAQKYDTLYLTHPNYAPRKLVRNAHDSWTLSTIDFQEPAWADINVSDVTLTPSATTGSGVTITASTGIFASTDVGRHIRMRNTVSDASDAIYPGTGSQTYFTIPFFPNDSTNVKVYNLGSSGAKTALVYTAGVPGAGEFTVTNGQVRTGDTLTTAQELLITQASSGSAQWGYALITGYTSATQVTVTVVEDFSGVLATTFWRLSAWGATTGYPKYVALYNQRLIFANNSSFPSTLWMSNTGDYENFRPDDISRTGTVLDTSAIVVNIDTPSVRWINGLQSLLVGGFKGVFVVASPSGGLSPLSVIVKRDLAVSSSDVLPVTTKDQIIFVEDLRKKVFATKYYFENSGYRENHLTKNYDNVAGTSTIVAIAHAESPNETLWVLREDGGLWSCTYVWDENTGQYTTGWAKHELGGVGVEVESICVIPGTTYSELWMIVKRTINGGTKRYMEYMKAEYNETAQEDAFFVDCGLTYSGSSVTTVTGLSHLEGQTVSVLGDGDAQNNKTVSGGSITLDVACTKVQAGLPYTSDLETPLIEGGSALGIAQMQISRVNELGIRFHETLGGYVGYSSDNLDEIIFNNTTDTMGDSPPVQNIDKVVEFNMDWERGYKAFIRQTQPYPMTILCLTYKVVLADV